METAGWILLLYNTYIYKKSGKKKMKIKKIPRKKYLERVCKDCKHNKLLDGLRFCRKITPIFDEKGNCQEYTQEPKKREEFIQISLFD